MSVQTGAQVGGSAQRNDTSAIHQGQPVTVLGFVHVVGADEDSVARACHFAYQIPECRARYGIHTRGGFIQKQYRRFVQNGATQCKALL
jgi:hypothetical protein